MIVSLLLPSILAALLIAISGGVLSCFVVWRRMAFFSDALAHSAMLGTALALLLKLHLLFGLFAYGLLVAALLAFFTKRLEEDGDTLLALTAQTSLAGGMLLLPLTGQHLALESLLFGDVLAITWADVGITAVFALLIVLAMWLKRGVLIDSAMDEDLAAAEGVAVMRYKMLLFFLLVALIAVAIQVVGVLLIGALLLIPAMTARRFSQTPEQMLLLSPVFGVLAVAFGMTTAVIFNAQAGPAIVVAAALMWLLSLAKK